MMLGMQMLGIAEAFPCDASDCHHHGQAGGLKPTCTCKCDAGFEGSPTCAPSPCDVRGLREEKKKKKMRTCIFRDVSACAPVFYAMRERARA